MKAMNVSMVLMDLINSNYPIGMSLISSNAPWSIIWPIGKNPLEWAQSYYYKHYDIILRVDNHSLIIEEGGDGYKWGEGNSDGSVVGCGSDWTGCWQ